MSETCEFRWNSEICLNLFHGPDHLVHGYESWFSGIYSIFLLKAFFYVISRKSSGYVGVDSDILWFLFFSQSLWISFWLILWFHFFDEYLSLLFLFHFDLDSLIRFSAQWSLLFLLRIRRFNFIFDSLLFPLSVSSEFSDHNFRTLSCFILKHHDKFRMIITDTSFRMTFLRCQILNVMRRKLRQNTDKLEAEPRSAR
jgi:hypothetical protein